MLGYEYWYTSTKYTWKEECHKRLPSPEHAKLRERLLQLEDIHGDAMRTRFPPAPVDEYEDLKSLRSFDLVSTIIIFVHKILSESRY